tara:strand:+ start:1284 stop:4331 length:3048 start_codon:yes stop_codon:yes gene_type:complete
MAIKGACINIIESDNDSMHISKFSLEQLRKDKEIPASDSVSFLESLGVKDGAIDNIQSEKTIDMATQFFKEYKQKVADSNYDSPSLRDIADETIPGFRGLKLIAPVYYVLQKGGKSSKKLADKLLDFDVVYTRDKAFADETIDQVVNILGKDVKNMNLLEPEMRKQKGRVLSGSEKKATEAFDLINPKTKKLWSMKDDGFQSLDTFTKKHIVAREYHRQMTDFYWKRIKTEMKAKSNKFQYEEFLAEFDGKYIQNYMTRAVSREVLMDIQKHSTASPVIVKIANERLKSRASELASKKFKKDKNPDKWEAEYDKNLKDTELLRSIKEEAINIMTYNPARVVLEHFKKRGILLPFETEITTLFGKKKKVQSYESDYNSVMDRYSTVTSKFISTTKFFPEFTNFGTKYKISGGAKSNLFDMQNSSNKQHQYIANHIDELLGLSTKDSNAITNFLATTSTLSAATGLSSPTSGIKNLLITIPRTLGTFPMLNTAKATLDLFNNYGELMTDARRKGFTTYQTKTLALQDKAIKLPFNLGTFSMESLFKVNLMTQTEGIGRVAQVQSGLMTFEQQLAKSHGVKNILNKGGKDKVRDFWKNVFKLSDDEIEFLFDKESYRKIQNGLSDTEMTGKMDYIRAKVAHYSHVSVSGGTGAQLLPSWMNNKYVKPMSLFYRMAYSTTFDMGINHIRPIFKNGNIAPLAKATMGSALSGWALWAMYDALFDTKNPTENEDALTQIASFLWRAEFLQLGSDMLNPYGANLYSKKSAFDFLDFNDQMMASSFNPIYGTAVFRNLSSAASLFGHTFLPSLGFADERKFKGQALDDFMSNTVVLYAQYRKNFQEPFGPGFKNDKLYKTQKEFSTYARRWKSENNYKQTHLHGQSTITPYYRSLRNSFYNGNQKDFDRAYWAAYNYIITDMIKNYRRTGKGLDLKKIHKKAMSNLNRSLSSYSVSSLSETFDVKNGGIVPEKEFKKYLKDRKLLDRYKKAKIEFEYRKRKLVNRASSLQNKRKYSAMYDLFE